MQNQNQNKNRKSIRLKEFDYSEPNDYFITICTQNRECLFGEIKDGEMVLNEIGEMINKWWLEMKNKFPDIFFDIFQIMPNHLHAIITVLCQDNVGEPLCGLPNEIPQSGRPHRAAPTIPDIVNWFKTMTTTEYIKNVKTKNWKPFNKHIWQRSFHDHIIRNQQSYNEIYTYIESNSQTWDRDKINPKNLI